MPLRNLSIWDVEDHSWIPMEPGSPHLLGVRHYHVEVGNAFTLLDQMRHKLLSIL